MTTERLYYTDAYLRDFDATVLDAADGGRRVYLDRTAFYPTSGGQPHDTGSLGGAHVLDVVDEDDRIAHLVERPLAPGPVIGGVDWPRRFDHMQQHTGQHLLSAVIADLFGFVTTAVHFGAATSTLDLDAPALAPEQVAAAEERANAVLTENRSVVVGFEDAGTAAGLRRPTDRGGTLRIVTIADLDRSACGGTHVRATGEIGPILIRKVERVRKAARVEFLCGARAVRRARADHDLLGRLAGAYSAAAEDLPLLLEQQRGELKRTIAARDSLETDLDARRARELYDGAPPGPAGIRRIVLRDEGDATVERLRALGQAVTRMGGAVFIATTRQPPTVLVAGSEDSGVDAGRALRAALEPVGGRGGGNPRQAQGTAPAEALETVVGSLLGQLGSG